MNGTLALVLLCLLLGACAAQRVDVSVFPADIHGTGQDMDDPAAYEALTFFKSKSARPATAAQAARALADVEYLAGEVNTNPRFSTLSGSTQVQMLQARDEVRAVLGVAPGARSQQIVDALLAVSRTNERAAQVAALADPIFTLGPPGTLARLTALPPMPVSVRALDQLWLYAFRSGDAR